ncbi:response regulator [Pyxidicoccus fallax]|uniref:Response regulator n=1 Tax=Pyxidicoccus fallax TaxID=394095 RepID=A0A848LZG4_9BACT|nr:response regulator [Pyxidicoccus fallax]NMO23246.1 response regulator [Pyxidicoccus fallax]NPC86119.1 response regulator [Pyxidicoccus fallax]
MRRYLLLDDNRAFAENLAEILRDEGDQATVVTSGDEAVRLARTTRFDALLTDMRMPGMSGADAVHHLRRVDPGLAAVVITAYPREDDLETARREGLLAVLPKPVPIPTLVGLLSGARRDGLVVLVEDDPALSDNLTEVLRAKGFSCVTAHSVLDTERISCVEPFAALVDLRVPGGPDGEALRRLRARYPNLSTFVITAFPDASLTAGASGVFSKPFDTGALVHALETAYAARPARAS